MVQIFNIKDDGLLTKQNLRHATEIVDRLGEYLDDKSMDKEFVEKLINKALEKISKRDTKFAKLILDLLQSRYPDCNFKI